MARKTLAQKRLAQQRKKIRLLQQNSSPQPKITGESENSLKQNNEQSKDQPENKQLINFFRADLKKSMSVILAIIALEIVFYFASMNGYFTK